MSSGITFVNSTTLPPAQMRPDPGVARSRKDTCSSESWRSWPMVAASVDAWPRRTRKSEFESIFLVCGFSRRRSAFCVMPVGIAPYFLERDQMESKKRIEYSESKSRWISSMKIQVRLPSARLRTTRCQT